MADRITPAEYGRYLGQQHTAKYGPVSDEVAEKAARILAAVRRSSPIVQGMRVVADTVDKTPSRGLRQGRQLAPAPMRTPGRWAHAFDDGAGTTLCGLDVASLHPFPSLTFDQVNPYLRCRECMAAADVAL